MVSSPSSPLATGGTTSRRLRWARFRTDTPRQTQVWALLPLRVFLGGTFLYAGLTKIFDTHYLNHASALGVHSQMLHAAQTFPIGPLVSLTAEHSTVAGLAIAFGVKGGAQAKVGCTR